MSAPDDQPPAPPCSRAPGRPRSEAARQAILNAAYELLQEVDLPNITSSQLAKRAGVSKATLYRWWPSKEAVVLDGYFHALEHRIVTPNTGDPLADLTAHVREAYTMMAGDEGRIFASLVASGTFHPKIREALNQELNSPRCHDTEDLLARAQTAGLLAPDADLELCAELLWGPAFYRLMTATPFEPDLADRVLGLLLSGFGAPDTPGETRPK